MTAFDPGPAVARGRLDEVELSPMPVRISGTSISVGVAGWTDRTLTARDVFYPREASTPEARLRYYAACFPLVEVDATYYALPSPDNAARWVERTPDAFTFDVKAFALMTGHAAETARLPAIVREALPPELRDKTRLYAHELPPPVDELVWSLFADGIRPLAEPKRLGAVFLQLAPWVVPTRESPRMLERARERLADFPVAVEFRNRRWLEPRLRERTLSLLQRLEMSYVVVDEPQGMESSVPPEIAATTPTLGVLRMHGQRADYWEQRGIPVVEKYRYLYSPDELEAWVERILELANQVERLHIVFNNCYANYAVCNAAEMIALLRRENSSPSS